MDVECLRRERLRCGVQLVIGVEATELWRWEVV